MSSPKHLHELAQPIFVVETYITCGDEVLMFKRSASKKKFPGFWSLPGGHLDAGEDPLAAAIREVAEETDLIITAQDIKLKVVALHHHLDRQETYIAFAFLANITTKVMPKPSDEEGEAHWISKAEVLVKENVFPPVKYYFDHVLNDKPGVLYNMSEWRDAELVRVMSETIDSNR